MLTIGLNRWGQTLLHFGTMDLLGTRTIYERLQPRDASVGRAVRNGRPFCLFINMTYPHGYIG